MMAIALKNGLVDKHVTMSAEVSTLEVGKQICKQFVNYVRGGEVLPYSDI